MTTATVWAGGGGGGAQIVNTILVLFNCNIDPWPQSHKLHTAAPSTRLLKLTAQLGSVDISGLQWRGAGTRERTICLVERGRS